MKLYGRYTTIGYLDYKYNIWAPKKLTIGQMMDGSYEISLCSEIDTIPENELLKMFKPEQEIVKFKKFFQNKKIGFINETKPKEKYELPKKEISKSIFNI